MYERLTASRQSLYNLSSVQVRKLMISFADQRFRHGRIPKYHVKTLSPVEEAYFDSIKKLTTETKKKKKK